MAAGTELGCDLTGFLFREFCYDFAMLRDAKIVKNAANSAETPDSERWQPDQRHSQERVVWLVDPIGAIPGEGLLPSRTWAVARALVAAGHGVIWWTSSFSHARKIPRLRPAQIFDEEGFHVRLIAARQYRRDFSLARFASHRDFARNFERIACESIAAGQLERPDLVLATSPPPDHAEAATRVARRLDAAMVIDVVDWWPGSLRPLVPGPAWLARPAIQVLLPRIQRRQQQLLGRADAVLAGSRTTASQLLLREAPQLPLKVVPTGSYVQDYNPPRPLIDEVPPPGLDGQQRARPAPLAVAVAGDLESKADLLLLVDLARTLSSRQLHVSLHVIGGGRWMQRLTAAAPLVGGSCRIVPHGLLDRSRYVDQLSSCQVGIVLSGLLGQSPLPTVASDYAAAGLSLVVAGAGELAAVVQAAEAGLVGTPPNAETMAEALTVLATSPRTLSEQRQAARRLAETTLDREQLARELVAWLEMLHGQALKKSGGDLSAGQPVVGAQRLVE